MKKIYFYLTTVCLILLILTSINAENKTHQSDTYKTTDSKVYIIKQYKGNVAVYLHNSDSPVQVLDCKISSLPPDAAEALATGIKVYSEEELQKIIEAYD